MKTKKAQALNKRDVVNRFLSILWRKEFGDLKYSLKIQITYFTHLTKLLRFKQETKFIYMFLNYLPSEMIEVMELTIIFSSLVGTILFLLFTADKPNTKNLYMKKAR